MDARSASTIAESIFLDALDIPPAERAAFLDGACGDDDEIRRRVESLLSHADDNVPSPSIATGYFERSAGLSPLATPAEQLPIRLGRYDLLKRIGSGSFGVVYHASQRTPVRREVAIKIVRSEIESPEVIRRFNTERQALAALDHPNIARLYDAGNTPDGRPFFVMELADGQPLTQFCDAHRLTLRERLHLFADVCVAIEHAHRRAILHRDLKPTNLLAHRRDDGRPCVKVIDFGIARALGGGPGGNVAATEVGRLIGTPEYMSPEQAAGDTERVDTRSDVYALGVVLFELICGRLPFESRDLRSSTTQMRRLICEVAPPLPSKAWDGDPDGLRAAAAARATTPEGLRETLRRELEWIPLKALQKELADRYAGVAELGEDVQSYLDGLPLRAARQTRWYRARKFIARHRTPVALGLTAVSLLVMALGISFVLLHRARRAETNAVTNERTANIGAAMLRIQQGNSLIGLGRFGRAREQLEAAQLELSRLRGPSWIADLGLWDLSRNARPAMLEWKLTDGPIVGLQFLSDSRRAVGGSMNGDLILFDVRTGAVEARTRAEGERWHTIKVPPGGDRAILGDWAGRLFEWTLGNDPPKLLRTGLGLLLAVDSSGARTLHADPDGGVGLCVRGEPTIRRFMCKGPLTAAAFLPNDQFVTSGKYGVDTCVWSVADTQTPLRKINTIEWCGALAVSPDGQIAAAGGGHVVHMLDLIHGNEYALLRGHNELITSMVWAPPKARRAFYSCAWDGTCRGWSADGGEVDVFQGPSQPLHSLNISPDGKRIIAGGWDGKVYGWSAAPNPAIVDIHHREPIQWGLMGALLCDDEILAVGEATTPIVLYDCRTGLRLGDLGEESKTSGLIQGVTPTQLGFERRGALAIHDLASDSQVATLGETTQPGEPRRQVYSWRAKDVPRAAIWRRGVDLTVWDLASRKIIRKLSDNPDLTENINISPDGRYVMALHDEPSNGLELFEVDGPGRSWRLPSKLFNDDDPVSIAFSGDSNYILTRRRHIESFSKIWRTADRAFVRSIPDGNGVTFGDEFWPDNEHLLSTLEFGDALLRSSLTGEMQYTFREVGQVMGVSGLRRLVTKQQWKSHVTICDLEWPVRRRALSLLIPDAQKRIAAGNATADDFTVLGRWLALHGDDDWAIECLLHARELGARDDPIDLATSYVRSHRYAEAAAEYERAATAADLSVAKSAYIRRCLAASRLAAQNRKGGE